MRMGWVVAGMLLAGGLAAMGQSTPPAELATGNGRPVIRSGQTVLCQVGAGCMQETVHGERYLVMEQDGLTVKASMGMERKLHYADVAIVNATDAPVTVMPGEFRIEENAPKFKRLSYVPPVRKKQRKMKEEPVHDLPPPSYFTSEQHKRDMAEEAAVPVGPTDLVDTTVRPTRSVSGRVYFHGSSNKATSMSLFVRVSGLVFEFPYAP